MAPMTRAQVSQTIQPPETGDKKWHCTLLVLGERLEIERLEGRLCSRLSQLALEIGMSYWNEGLAG